MDENVGNRVRFRLEFDDKSQCSQGLRGSWFVLKPDITNFGQLATQIRECFGLRHHIALSMDNFALPSFLSTCLITNNDIIMVKKKEVGQNDICKPCVDGKSQESSQGNQSYDNGILTSCMENAVQLDPPGDAGLTRKKRKRSKNLLDSNGQNVEDNHENEFEPDNNSHMRKVDGALVSDGILPLPLHKPEVLPLVVDTTKACKNVLQFEILRPLLRLPIKGDILAYRYIEVESSSSVHPRLSSPQVGEVSSFDCKSLQVIILPVSDYVFSLDENPHETTAQPNASPYKEDGSLEISYLSLIDVRLVKVHDSEDEPKACQDEQTRKDKWEEASLNGNLNEHNASTPEQSSWPSWTPNKSDTAMSWSFKQPSARFAGRGNGLMTGRGNGRTNWASNRSMNNRAQSMNARNRNSFRNNAAWNPNWSNTRFSAIDNTASVPWSSGLPDP